MLDIEILVKHSFVFHARVPKWLSYAESLCYLCLLTHVRLSEARWHCYAIDYYYQTPVYLCMISSDKWGNGFSSDTLFPVIF